jgi:uncharacterized SAM-binding protein YcdF (DUF218 family)
VEGELPDESIPREVEPPPLTPGAIGRITRCVFRPAATAYAELTFVFGTIRARFDGLAAAWHGGHLRRLVLAGGCGPGWDSYGVPIARGMRNELLALGVPAAAIAVQDRSQNTLEDVAFSLDLIGTGAAAPDRIAFASKAHHSGRCHLTLRRFFPDAELLFHPLPAAAGGAPLDAATWHDDRAARARVYAEYLRIIAYSARGDIAAPEATATGGDAR